MKKGENARNVLQTDVSVKVEKIFKGDPYSKDNVLVRINKGVPKNMIVNSNGYPNFEIGEEVVFFLSKDDSDIANPYENYYVLI